ncbi:metal-dependent hydrolase [Pontibacter sp. G13]|uniref:metal-dependent hydrolase n=1 Tax=Pontibacter sp. G13 TaxID=3074898 RepID=UPI00288AF41E|nr:metal-dependent hydrolase [Pontibacter sp. G13]WNJ18264.1 metal-dependent hydrolase [Pontibacter sp. G13]
MDIISHTLTGVAVGTVAATLSNGSWKQKGLIVLAGGLGGALPDLDAISYWSQFDSTIGSFLQLSHSGREIYGGRFWYSHHAALHSILAPLLLILLTTFVRALLRRELHPLGIVSYLKARRYIFSAFFFGFLFHLLEDMPTPASVWGGVNLFFPSSNYVGGLGKIWWWNNYDLVLIILSVIVANVLLNAIPKRFYVLKVRSALLVFALGVAMFLFQINTRTVDFSYTGHTPRFAQFENQSKEIQREILGERLYRWMAALDRMIPLNF